MFHQNRSPENHWKNGWWFRNLAFSSWNIKYINIYTLYTQWEIYRRVIMSPVPKFNVVVEQHHDGMELTPVKPLKELPIPKRSRKSSSVHHFFMCFSCLFSGRGTFLVLGGKNKQKHQENHDFSQVKTTPVESIRNPGKMIKKSSQLGGSYPSPIGKMVGKPLGWGPLNNQSHWYTLYIGYLLGRKKTKQTPGVCEVHVPCIKNITWKTGESKICSNGVMYGKPPSKIMDMNLAKPQNPNTTLFIWNLLKLV